MLKFFRSRSSALKGKLRRKLRRPGTQPSQEQSATEDTPPKPLYPREKALSIIFSTELDRASKAGNVHAKPTFLLLPLEIRRQIVEYCVCGIPLDLNVVEELGQLKQNKIGILMRPIDVIRKRFVLSIPLTCRQLIKFGFGMTIIYLPRKLITQRLNMINDMWLVWHVFKVPLENTFEKAEWTKVWEIIASMEGLKKVLVQIFPIFLWEDQWPSEEKRLLEDAKLVTRPERFELELGWPEGPIPLELPCDITRVSNDLFPNRVAHWI
ncbi:uncharacterized protein LY89DRAFT_759972 [Mollisia scopiformis]|uniref:DUF7730 domain-containing protein n=1 Tax=Mollisia scopiformis TaxID=149040 RepID=A0A194WTP1_MOLSC|nr:uncharacterized protein LY89DRAFT_759972 [Mollisia scopiformis]KUJ10977.1 hypothetical protein LY89DRAFT_759972 [Mollisia scopiformis]